MLRSLFEAIGGFTFEVSALATGAAAFLASAGLMASFAAAAASDFDFASAVAVSSCFLASSALEAAFCLRSSACAFA